MQSRAQACRPLSRVLFSLVPLLSGPHLGWTKLGRTGHVESSRLSTEYARLSSQPTIGKHWTGAVLQLATKKKIKETGPAQNNGELSAGPPDTATVNAARAMESPALVIAKASFAAVLLNPDPPPCSRADIEQFHALLGAAIAPLLARQRSGLRLTGPSTANLSSRR